MVLDLSMRSGLLIFGENCLNPNPVTFEHLTEMESYTTWPFVIVFFHVQLCFRG